ncbi:MAG TPA: ATP-binding protein [Acidobacteriaceae bacterium]
MAFAGLRTIRGQLVASLVLFELLALGFFTAVLFHERTQEAEQRMRRRLEYQASELQVVARLALRDGNAELLHTVVDSMMQFPTIRSVEVTDPSGRVLAASDARLNNTFALKDWERGRVPGVQGLQIFRQPSGSYEAVLPVRMNGGIAAYLWICPSDSGVRGDLRDALLASAWGSLAVLLACTLLATLIARSLTRPLTQLLSATRMLISNPEDTSAFPLQVTSSNEAADLIVAFNLMVGSMHEQRRGLNDTLALLDSMLANAPIGIAFFDRKYRFVRVNRFLGESHVLGVERYLGRRVDEVFTPAAALSLERAIEEIFEHGSSVQELEVSGEVLSLERDGEVEPQQRTWLVNVYPVRTAAQATRWAGVVLIDITQRLRAEQALRDTEKLSMAGRLAASIAHEINNPLEAVTNLLYLLRHHGELAPQARDWAVSAQHEVERVSAITQQTLRFHRQSTRRMGAQLTDLLDSVLTLYRGRVATLQVAVERRYRPTGELLCFTGELRQLFANLIGNALDAMQPGGGRLILSVRASQSWREPEGSGVRVTIADTGCGMSRKVQSRIFEPFYTTKEATGTGLGLWVGAEIMAKHGVRLRIRSRQREPGEAVGGGTVFLLFFPFALAEPAAGVEDVSAAVVQ